jgi:SAM-dependent methyltransferase
MTGTGNLSVEAQARYLHIEELLLAEVPPPAKVVELGSAPGDQIVRLADLGYSATSVDIGEASDEWGSGEQGRMFRLLEDHQVEDVRWNLEQIPYPLPKEEFDAVVMTEVFEHLRDYPINSLREIRRILKPSGRLYLTTPNAAYVMNRLRALCGKSTATPLKDWIGGLPHARHAREYTFAEMEELARVAGLTVINAYSRHFHMDSGRTGKLSRGAKWGLASLARVERTLGPAIIMVASPQPSS